MNPSSPTHPLIAITTGEPTGIGPEISLRAAWQCRHTIQSVLIGDAGLLSTLVRAIDATIALRVLSSMQAVNHKDSHKDQLMVIDCPVTAPVIPGQLDVRHALPVLHTLDLAIEGTMNHTFSAMVTAPIQKSILNDAGIPFSGHTEYLAKQSGTPHVVMMLATHATTPPLRVALATTHLALKDVATQISQASLKRTLTIIHHDLQTKFGLTQPRIIVTGLNPHAGEGGHLGREEIDILLPVITNMKQKGMQVSGPYPADTLFQPKYLAQADCILAMYHDQGLPVLKYASFGRGVNITLGLPFIRTSVDHGTALDVARKGVGIADCGSMVAALEMAAGTVRSTLSADPNLPH